MQSLKKQIAFLMAAIMAFSITWIPVTGSAAWFSDMPNNWSTPALESAVANGLLSGANGKISPNEKLTRAEMATIINRAFGSTEKASLEGYSDIAANSWYYNDMAKAVKMGTFVGTGNQLNPNGYITRQEVFLVLARAFKLADGKESSLDNFKDSSQISTWAKGAVSAMADGGYVKGAEGKMNPLSNITRAEFAQIMYNLVKGYIKEEGTCSSVEKGNVIINVPNVTLKNVTVSGDLIIGDGVGDGDVTLDNVNVTGRTVIRGGGIHSIKITGNSKMQNIIVARVDGQVRVFAEDGTTIGEVLVDGKDDVTIEGDVGNVKLVANNVTVTATNAEITSASIEGDHSRIVVASNSTVSTMTVGARNAEVEVSGKVTNIVINSEGATVSGKGKVGSVAANADNVVVSTPNTNVKAAAGTTGVKAGAKTVSEGTTRNTTSTGSGGSSHSTPAPTISTVSPTAGTVAGATTVTITGTYLTGATAVMFGGTPATSFTVNSDTQITAVAPAHAAGAVNLIITTSGGSVTANGAYTYVAAPTVATISPVEGPATGGTTITISGTNFTGATAVSIGSTPAASFTVNSATQITAVTPAHATGTANVVVTTPGGSATATGAYTYVAGPTVSTVSPAVGPAAGGSTLTISGTGLTGATAVTFGGTPATSFTVNSATQITAVTPAHTVAAVDVVVSTPGGSTTATGAYTYADTPTITDVSPIAGPVAGGTTIIINGTNFTGATNVEFGTTAATSFTVDSATQITAVAPAHAAGTVNLVVTTPGGTVTGTGAYTYAAAPTVATVSPVEGPAAGGTTITISGTNFTGASAVTIGGTPATSFSVNSATEITAVTPAHAAGAVDLAVTTPGGAATATGAYTYVAGPTVSTGTPSAGPAAGGTTVTIWGTNFTGATAVSFGGTSATSFAVDSDTQITAVTPAHTAGAVNVAVVTVGGTAVCAGAYNYVEVPNVSLITPATGSTEGGTSVTISGTNFTGASEVTIGGTPVTSFTVDSDTQITAVTPAHAPGFVNLSVTTVGGTGTRTNVYTYITPVSFGNSYLLATDADATVFGGADVPFSNNGALSGVSHTAGTTTFTIPESGDYLLNYGINMTAGVGAQVGIAVNGIVDSSTVVPVLSNTGEFSGCAVLSLSAGDVITLRNNSAVALTLSLAPAVGAQLNITKVDASYGYGYQMATIGDATVVGGADVPFSNNGPLFGVTHTPGTTIFTVSESGDYLINYGINVTSGYGAQVGIAINGVVDLSTTTPVLSNTGELSGCAILSLIAGDVITLRNNSAVALTMALAPSVGAQMNITKVDASRCYGYQLATVADATVVGGADVPFSNNGPLSGVTHNAGTTTFTVSESGNYLINYGINMTAGVGAQVGIAINGVVDPSTATPVLSSTGEFSGCAVLSLSAGDVITLRNNSAVALTLSLAPAVGAQLNITKLQ